MPTDLAQHQHELLYPDGSTAMLFGTLETGYLTLNPPLIEANEGIVGDLDRPREDGRAFGEDYRSAKTVSFEIGVLTDRTAGYGDPLAANIDALEKMAAVWDHPRFRSGPGKIGVLRSRSASSGLTWRCYGRPRNFAEAPGQLTSKGYTPITAEFHLADGRWYAETERSESISLPPSYVPGLIGPLTSPLSTVGITASTNGQVVIGGNTGTWPVITFTGPVTNPSITLGGTLEIGLDGTIAAGQSVTVDSRPWARTVLRNDGANYAGMLTADTPVMRKMLLEPGTYLMKFSGIDATATCTAAVTWRDARMRP